MARLYRAEFNGQGMPLWLPEEEAESLGLPPWEETAQGPAAPAPGSGLQLQTNMAGPPGEMLDAADSQKFDAPLAPPPVPSRDPQPVPDRTPLGPLAYGGPNPMAVLDAAQEQPDISLPDQKIGPAPPGPVDPSKLADPNKPAQSTHGIPLNPPPTPEEVKALEEKPDPLVMKYFESLLAGSGRGGPSREMMTPESYKQEYELPMSALLPPEEQARQEAAKQQAFKMYEDARRRTVGHAVDVGKFQALAQERALVEQRIALEQSQRRLAEEADTNERIAVRQAELQSKIASFTDEARNAENPSARTYWASKGPLGMIFAALGNAVHGRLAGETGTENQGLKFTREAIRQYVHDMERIYERAVDMGNAARTELGQLIEQYGTPEAAKQALELKKTAHVVAIAENRKNQAATEAEGMAWDGLLLELEEELAAKQAALFNTGKVKIAEESKRRVIGGGGQGPMTPGEAAEEAANFRKHLDEILGREGLSSEAKERQRGRQIRLPNGESGWVNVSGETAFKIEKDLERGNQVIENFARISHLLSDDMWVGRKLDRDQLMELKQLIGIQLPLASQAEGMGVINGPDAEFLGPMAGMGIDDLARFRSTSKRQVDTALWYWRRRYQQALGRVYRTKHGTHPVSEMPAETAPANLR